MAVFELCQGGVKMVISSIFNSERNLKDIM